MEEDRSPLEGDWEQRNYISSTTLNGRIDWDGLEEAEQHAHRLIEKWEDGPFDNYAICYSGGIDSVVVLHMAKQHDIDWDIFTVTTPEHYPSDLEYLMKSVESLGMEDNHYVKERSSQGMEWLVDKPRFVFPDHDQRYGLIERRQRSGLSELSAEHDTDLRMYGRRVDTSSVEYLDGYVSERNGYRAYPIKDWNVYHVLAYLEKHDIPISPIYRAYHSDMGGTPWHIRHHKDRQGNVVETIPECWWAVRDYCLNYGYTSFWERIIENFPEGEDKALDFTMESDKSFPDIEDGYERGCDVKDNDADLSD